MDAGAGYPISIHGSAVRSVGRRTWGGNRMEDGSSMYHVIKQPDPPDQVPFTAAGVVANPIATVEQFQDQFSSQPHTFP